MKKLFFFVLFSASTAVFAQNESFPKVFLGNWKGKMQWVTAGKSTVEYTVQLSIQPSDTAGQYTWHINYGDEGKDNRPYLLKVIDSVMGHWVIDELDGIILDNYVHGNSIHGAFTVDDATLVDNYWVENGKLHTEFFTINLKDKIVSGKGTKDSHFVYSYKIVNYHTGVLIRTN